MSGTMVALVAMEAKSAAEGKETFQERAVAAMTAAKNHWMVLDENAQYAGACAALYELSDDDTKERIKAELDLARALNAAGSGVPVDMASVLDRFGDREPLGLMKTWREIPGPR